MVDNGELENLMLCVWKKMSNNPDSTTFQKVRDDTHSLYKCYECCGSRINTCEDYRPVFRFDKIISDYR